jgi:hypothetical protein
MQAKPQNLLEKTNEYLTEKKNKTRFKNFGLCENEKK